MDKFLKRPIRTNNNKPDNLPSTSGIVKNIKLFKGNAVKIILGMDCLISAMKRLQNRCVKQRFQVNLLATQQTLCQSCQQA